MVVYLYYNGVNLNINLRQTQWEEFGWVGRGVVKLEINFMIVVWFWWK